MRIFNFLNTILPTISEDAPSCSSSEKSHEVKRSLSASDLVVKSRDFLVPTKSCESLPPLNKASLNRKSTAFGTMQLILGSCELPPSEQGDDNINVLYEERPLCHLIGVDKPSVVITSKPVAPAVIGYYLGLKGARGQALKQLIDKTCVLTANGESSDSLSLKVLGNRHLLGVLQTLTDTNEVQIICHSGSENIDSFAVGNVGYYHDECDSELLHLGTKTGNRKVFEDAKVQYPAGVPHPTDDGDLVNHEGFLMSREALVAALARQIERKGFVKDWIIKLNEGVAGRGNALLALRDSTASLKGDALKQAIDSDLATQLTPFDTKINAAQFLAKIPETGVIGELFVKGELPQSPSYQGFIDASGEVITVSTHEQILDGQTYKGCKFPADAALRDRLISEGEKIGIALSDAGAKGHFGVDFLATTQEQSAADGVKAGEQSATALYAIEINLRNTGTSYPFTTVTRLTDGTQSSEGDCIVTKQGNRRFYTALDYVVTDKLKGVSPEKFVKAVKKTDIHWDDETEKGVVFHLFGLLAENGRVGATAIAESPEAADALLEKTKIVLETIGENESAKVAPDQYV